MRKKIFFLTFLIGLISLPFILAEFILPYAIIKPYKPLIREGNFAQNIEFQDQHIQLNDSLSLAVRMFLPATDTAKGGLIFLHGIGSCKEHQYNMASAFAAKGFLSLAYDARAHGESEGLYCHFGATEKFDVLKLAENMRKKLGKEKAIGLIGHSMGAAVALQSLALTDELSFGVILSPFSNLEDIVLDRMELYSYLRWKPYADYVLNNAGKIGGFDPLSVNPAELASSIEQPIFLAHGSEDKQIKAWHGEKVFKALASEIKEFHLVEGAGHNNLFDKGGPEFSEKIASFVEAQFP
ncbi:MAG: alpha/beta fold hydrolase [Bacteroidota bacterium]